MKKQTPPLCNDAPPVNFELTEDYIKEEYSNLLDRVTLHEYEGTANGEDPRPGLAYFQNFVAQIVNTVGFMMAQGISEKFASIQYGIQKDNAAYLVDFITGYAQQYKQIAATNRDNLVFLEEQKQKL